ncbi:unnamed protein product [Dibothriocephalus latus]|uniref:Uncharacterized protein n=1 Tax=Dibothriocephalus latus TaxID=60516 RepID=A0A3P6VE81_DIBLA|nr:unnamed protein product [Dibothriocephalus latus]
MMYLQVIAVQYCVEPENANSAGDQEDVNSFTRALYRGSVITSAAKEVEANRQWQELFQRMDSEEVRAYIQKLTDDNDNMIVQTKCLHSELQWLSSRYAILQYQNIFLRFLHLRRSVKSVIYGELVSEIM